MPRGDQADLAALQRAILHSKAEQARAMPPGDKLLAGARLFDDVRERMKAGILARHADWTPEQVHREFLDQLARQRRQAEKGIYRLIGYLNDDGTMTPAGSADERVDEH